MPNPLDEPLRHCDANLAVRCSDLTYPCTASISVRSRWISLESSSYELLSLTVMSLRSVDWFMQHSKHDVDLGLRLPGHNWLVDNGWSSENLELWTSGEHYVWNTTDVLEFAIQSCTQSLVVTERMQKHDIVSSDHPSSVDDWLRNRGHCLSNLDTT